MVEQRRTGFKLGAMMQLKNIKTSSLVTLIGVALTSVTWVRLTSSSASEASSRQTFTKKTWPAQVQKEFNAQFARSSVAENEARQLLKERRLDEAEKACYRALALCPQVNGEPINIAAQQMLGDVYQAEGRYKEAIEVYQTSCKHSFNNEETELKIALCYLRLGDMDNAHKFYTEKKFYSTERFLGGTTAKEKADDFSMLPGDKTPKTMEASLLYTLGAERNLYGYSEEANALYKKTLELAPRNALAARYIAWNLDFLGKRDEAVPYWARAAVFGKGYIAEQGKIALNDHLMPDKQERALSEARKIR